MKATLTALLFVVMTLATKAEIVTLKAYDDWNQSPDPAKHTTQSVEISADQTIELLSLHPIFRNTNARIEIRFGESVAMYSVDSPCNVLPPLLLRGPVKVTLIPSTQGGLSIATFRIAPERVDPTQTVIVYPGTNNAAKVTMLCSTNLADWSPATNGVYSGDVAKFFRIGIEKTEK